MGIFDQRGQSVGNQSNSGSMRGRFDQRGQQVGNQANVAGGSRAAFERWWASETRPTDPKEAAWQAWVEQD